jgi:hypothetical protein
MEYTAKLGDLDGLRVKVILKSGAKIEGEFTAAPPGWTDMVGVGSWVVAYAEVAALRVSESDGMPDSYLKGEA